MVKYFYFYYEQSTYIEGAVKVSDNVEIAPRRQQGFTFWVM